MSPTPVRNKHGVPIAERRLSLQRSQRRALVAAGLAGGGTLRLVFAERVQAVGLLWASPGAVSQEKSPSFQRESR